jgi:hypothetical protein
MQHGGGGSGGGGDAPLAGGGSEEEADGELGHAAGADRQALLGVGDEVRITDDIAQLQQRMAGHRVAGAIRARARTHCGRCMNMQGPSGNME